jgi:hypothetical protein
MKRKSTTVLGFIVMIFFFATCAKMLYNLENYPRDNVNLAYEFGLAAKQIVTGFWSGWKH